MLLRAIQSSDPELDSCNNHAVAALEHNGTTMMMCTSCLHELFDAVTAFSKTIHCYQCLNYTKVPEEMFGTCTKTHRYVEILDTCDSALKKQSKKS